MKFGAVKDHGHTYKLYLNKFLFDTIFKYGDGAIFSGYVGTNSEPLCVDFCIFLECHIL
jgi:hypothetical protein